MAQQQRFIGLFRHEYILLLSVFPSVQSVRLSPRTGLTPIRQPFPGTDARWQSVLIYAQDGHPGPIGVLVYVSFLNLMSIMSVS